MRRLKDYRRPHIIAGPSVEDTLLHSRSIRIELELAPTNTLEVLERNTNLHKLYIDACRAHASEVSPQ